MIKREVYYASCIMKRNFYWVDNLTALMVKYVKWQNITFDMRWLKLL